MSMSPELQQDIADVERGTERVTRPGRWRVERGRSGRILVEMFGEDSPSRRNPNSPTDGPFTEEEREDRERQMTQAPTPGPLSGGLEHVVRNSPPFPDYPGHAIGKCGIGCPMFAPTAPVEASGSERDVAWKILEEIPAINDLGSQFQEDIQAAIVKALRYDIRPQPSGETRDEVARIVDPAAFLFKADELMKGDTSQYDAFNKADRILALVRPAPVASGGQHSRATDFPPDDVLACVEDTTPARAEALSEDDARRRLIQRIEQWDGETEYDAEDIASLADDILHEFNGAPEIARAEAEDEGAAGEASAYRVRMISNDPAEWVLMHPEKALDFLSRKGWESQPLYAHPSPTPAADADRVRIAVEALEATKDRVLTWPIEDHETCMCGSPVEGHNIGSGHSPVSQGDHAISMIVEAINEALARLSTTEVGG